MGVAQGVQHARHRVTGFIHVLDRRRCDMVSHDIGEALEAPGTVLADAGDGRGHQLHPEEIGQQLDQTLLGQMPPDSAFTYGLINNCLSDS